MLLLNCIHIKSPHSKERSQIALNKAGKKTKNKSKQTNKQIYIYRNQLLRMKLSNAYGGLFCLNLTQISEFLSQKCAVFSIRIFYLSNTVKNTIHDMC